MNFSNDDNVMFPDEYILNLGKKSIYKPYGQGEYAYFYCANCEQQFLRKKTLCGKTKDQMDTEWHTTECGCCGIPLRERRLLKDEITEEQYNELLERGITVDS